MSYPTTRRRWRLVPSTVLYHEQRRTL